ncbi:MAG: 16S rRNA methyltransferase, partial [Actinomycetales bacterium]
ARARVTSDAGCWLDVCSGPGGKAALLAGLAATQQATLVAVELHDHRAELVRRALGPAGGEVLHADARTEPWGSRRFDRVLVDAPCTGIGALRRRPEARWRRSASDLVTLGPLQRDLLVAGLYAAAAGGVVAYVTCSPHLAETEAVVADVLRREPGWETVDAPALLPEVTQCAQGPFVQLWPHRHGTDAMFLALLQQRPA